MTLWQLLLFLVAAAGILWLIEIAPFLSEAVKPIIRWVVIVAIVFVLLNALGALQFLKTTTIG